MPTKSLAIATGINVPETFICPLTSEVMIRPLMTRSGLNFERSAILEHLQNGNGTCPITKATMRLSDLIPNRVLEEKIARWRFENMLPDPSPWPDDNSIVGIASPKKNEEKIFYRHMAQRLRKISKKAPAAA